jgi:hypothetical protein
MVFAAISAFYREQNMGENPDRSRGLKIALYTKTTSERSIKLVPRRRIIYQIHNPEAKTTPWLLSHREKLSTKEPRQVFGWQSSQR